jgi:thiamine-monophosphate kinase
LSAWLPPGRGTLVGIGDDAAVLATPDGRVVATTDFLLEGRHFRRDWSAAVDVGHKAAARSLADVAAMGAEPSALLVALAAPPGLPVSWARELAAGLAAECARASAGGASVIGGDTARADQVVLAVTGLGDLAGRNPVLRSGAAPGDLVAVAGVLGHAAAGLALLIAGITADPRVAPLIAGHVRPAPPYDAGPEAADLGATAMIDVSDGLLADLGHVAAASGVLIDLDSAALRPGDRLITAARAVAGSRPDLARTGRAARSADDLALSWVLTGGEDHSLVATFPLGTRLPPRWTAIGAVRAGNGVLVDGHAQPDAPGWDHFGLLARDLAGLDAGGAHVHALGRAADRDAAALDVRVPAATGTAVRERDVVAEDRPLAAYVADGSHSSLHLTRFRKGRVRRSGRIRQPSKLTRWSRRARTHGQHCRPALLCCQV